MPEKFHEKIQGEINEAIPKGISEEIFGGNCGDFSKAIPGQLSVKESLKESQGISFVIFDGTPERILG